MVHKDSETETEVNQDISGTDSENSSTMSKNTAACKADAATASLDTDIALGDNVLSPDESSESSRPDCSEMPEENPTSHIGVVSSLAIQDAAENSGPEDAELVTGPDEKRAVKGISTQTSYTADDGDFDQALDDWTHICNMYQNTRLNGKAHKEASRNKFDKAALLWKEASDRGYSKASFNLGQCYALGKGVSADPEKVCIPVSSNPRHEHSQLAFPLQAFEYYSLAADEGHPKATYNLAQMYAEGQGGLPVDGETARVLMTIAADLGLKEAQRELGVMYTEDGRRDLLRAASLFTKAADQGDPLAMYYLGLCYQQGLGVSENQYTAARLYKKAADQKLPEAHYSLGKMIEAGTGGVDADKITALDHYKMAVRGGHKASEREVTRLQAEVHYMATVLNWSDGELSQEDGDSTKSGRSSDSDHLARHTKEDSWSSDHSGLIVFEKSPDSTDLDESNPEMNQTSESSGSSESLFFKTAGRGHKGLGRNSRKPSEPGWKKVPFTPEQQKRARDLARMLAVPVNQMETAMRVAAQMCRACPGELERLPVLMSGLKCKGETDDLCSITSESS